MTDSTCGWMRLRLADAACGMCLARFDMCGIFCAFYISENTLIKLYYAYTELTNECIL